MMVKIQLNNWLKADYVKEGNKTATIVDEGKWLLKEETGYEKDVQMINLLFSNGDLKQISLNFTSLKNLVYAYGDETKHWEGKKVILFITDVYVKGEKKQSIIITPDTFKNPTANSQSKQ